MSRVPMFECVECGRKFFTERAAERAAFGNGCPGCGGSDIDVFVPATRVEAPVTTPTTEFFPIVNDPDSWR